MGSAAVLNLPLPPQPSLDLTDAEIQAVYKASGSATAKILKYEADMEGDDAILRAAVAQHQEYEKTLFSGEKKK